jgi:hypothetical protein
MEITWLDWFGYAASVVILISLTMSSIVRLRWINLAGAILFATFGFLIGSVPTGSLNACIALIDIYYLVKLYSAKDELAIVEVERSSPFLAHFLQRNKDELEHIFGGSTIPERDRVFLYLRDNSVAGLLAGAESGKTFTIHIDFVTRRYRDLRIGQFFLQEERLKSVLPKVSQLEARANDHAHEVYLRHVGFSRSDESQERYVKSLT